MTVVVVVMIETPGSVDTGTGAISGGKSESKLVPSNTAGTSGSSNGGVSSPEQPQVTLSASLDVPHTMLLTNPLVPHTMLSASSCVPQTMLSRSLSAVPHTMFSQFAPPQTVPHTMLSASRI